MSSSLCRPPNHVCSELRKGPTDGRLPLPIWLLVGGLTRLIAYVVVLGAVAALA